MFIGASPALAEGHPPDPGAESAFIAAINDHRASRGAPALAVHGELVGVARRWAAAMAEAGAISHNPNLAGSVQAPWTRLGENVGVGGDVDSLMGAFIASAEHHRIMVDAGFGHFGIGVVHGADGRMYTAHVFMEVAAEPANEPDPAAVPAPSPAPAATEPPPARSHTPASGGGVAPPAAAATAPTPLAVRDSLDHLSGLDRHVRQLPLATTPPARSSLAALSVHDQPPALPHTPTALDRRELISRAPTPGAGDGLLAALLLVGLVLLGMGARHPRARREGRPPDAPRPAEAVAAYRVTRPVVPARSRLRWVPASGASLAQVLGSPFQVSPVGSAMERTAPYRCRRLPVHDGSRPDDASSSIDLRGDPEPVDLSSRDGAAELTRRGPVRGPAG